MKNKPLLTASIVILFIAMSSRAQIKPAAPAEPQAKGASSSETKTFGKFTDSRDGKTYKTVKIGTQTWMAENLAYKAADGCTANDNDKKKAKVYGYLYTWKAAVNACPAGWHLPSDDEWTILTTYLGGEDVAGNKLKSITGWISIDSTNFDSTNFDTDTGASNSSGFTALPGGYSLRDTFYPVGYYGHWWSATDSGRNAWLRFLNYTDARVYNYPNNKSFGFSVRCIKD